MKTLYATIAAAMLLITPAYAQSNSNCGPASAAQALVNEYKEIPIISWMSDKGEVIMVYANLDTGTVTTFASSGSTYCIVSSGVNAHIGPPVKSKVPGKDGA